MSVLEIYVFVWMCNLFFDYRHIEYVGFSKKDIHGGILFSEFMNNGEDSEKEWLIMQMCP